MISRKSEKSEGRAGPGTVITVITSTTRQAVGLSLRLLGNEKVSYKGILYLWYTGTTDTNCKGSL